MKIAELIATHLEEAFAGNNWSDVNVKDTLDGITFQEATTVTRASSNTIAALLYHMTFYNRAIRQRLQGLEPEVSAANGFDLPPIISEYDWEQLKKNAFHTVNELANAIRNFPDERLGEENPAGKGSFYKKLQGIIEHNYYHLGQIVILKNLIKNDQQD
ncbi:MAG: DinB family protein [Ginsengibacter sp.]